MGQRQGQGAAMVALAVGISAPVIASSTSGQMSWWVGGSILGALGGVAVYSLWLMFGRIPIKVDVAPWRVSHVNRVAEYAALSFEMAVTVLEGGQRQVRFSVVLPDGTRVTGDEYQRFIHTQRGHDYAKQFTRYVDNPQWFGVGETSPVWIAFLASPDDLPGGQFPETGLILEYESVVPPRKLGSRPIPPTLDEMIRVVADGEASPNE